MWEKKKAPTMTIFAVPSNFRVGGDRKNQENIMVAILQRVVLGACAFSMSVLCAEDFSSSVAKEKQIPQNSSVAANKAAPTKTKQLSSTIEVGNYKAFTGKILGNGVRMRLHPDVESTIVKELSKNELLIIAGEKNDFYAVQSPADMKVYVFRSFILDNVVEGSKVNIRLAPELNSPIVGYLNTGDKVDGAISEKNHKWLEITPPKSVLFYIAKEYIEKVGGPEMKEQRDKKRGSVAQSLESAELFSQSEMMKPFEEVDFERISQSLTSIINEFSDFPQYSEKAKARLMELQEAYLQKKLAYLESKASKMSREYSASNGAQIITVQNEGESALTPKDRMKIWERVEESHFLSWAAAHHHKTMDDYYEEQKFSALQVSGIVEPYTDIVKNKPGNYIVRDRDMPRAYLYSTVVNLQNYVGKYVTLRVSPRPNNNFAFPAYYVLEVE